ncbi:Defective in cullin neddylation protein [Lachnellula hyalina]|uniref:Defective in cullin neddylation protein n=1 Tax=Lachnellula hyalina TaxID=1316788 RepID=A0A8H8R9R8_9HELO|nr:Defective in cullin neddylation protein [Lachnellula hyalina]TVY29405.1 Defective in cullin neddylation protein [Lachnellula hyalina]
MPPLTPLQRNQVSQFMGLTGVPEKTAQRLLKASGWKIENASDRNGKLFTGFEAHMFSYNTQRAAFFLTGFSSRDEDFDRKSALRMVALTDALLSTPRPDSATPLSFFAANGSAAPGAMATRDSLDKLFESYRDAKTDERDTVSVDGTMAYFKALGVSLEDASMLVPMEIVQAPTVGEISKQGFIDGWKAVGADTIPKQKAYVIKQVNKLSTDIDLFKRVYRHVFVCAREKGQKAISLENALTYWQIIFSPPGKLWVTASTDWLKLWSEFLTTNWTKSVNKDMWNQTFEFAQKTMQDETLSFWSEESAWPGVIDEFVVFAKEKRGDVPMETD